MRGRRSTVRRVSMLVLIVLLAAGCAGSSEEPNSSPESASQAASEIDGAANSPGADSAAPGGRADVVDVPDTSSSAGAAEVAVPYDPTPMDVVDAMLERSRVGPGDVVVDLGSGDGRIPIRAAETFGARGVGYELDSALVVESRRAAREAGVADRVTFYERDLFEADIEDATVVTLYLFADVNRKLRPKLLRELDPGDRVVSHRFDMGDWEPDEKVVVGSHWFFLWTISEERSVSSDPS